MAADGDAPIAAFAVSKGGVVLKHIFLNAPPPPESTTTAAARGGGDGGEEEDPPVMVGRHPDCHVLVDHPSVSRFHLQLRCRRAQRRIAVTDLCSVHGTWVSGRRIPPSTPVDLAAGDTLRLGASKREYRLLWLSLREALEMDDPLHMPSLPEEDKEHPCVYEEATSLLEPVHKESADMETNQETNQQLVSEDIAFPAKVGPSAPPLPEFGHSIFAEEASVSQFPEKRDGVTKEKLVDKNPISESFGSLIIHEMPATMTNAGKSVQSGKRDASNQVSKRSKLKSVKSLHIDTGRGRERSSTPSYSFQKGEPNEILVCSQSCGTECTACIALFGNSEFERADEKEEVIVEDKVHLNPPSCITMEDKKESILENYVPEDLVDVKLQKRLGLFDSALLLPFKDDALADKEIPEWNDATANMESVTLAENPITPEMKHAGLTHLNLEGSLSNKENMGPKIAEDPENYQLEGTICGNLLDNLDAEGIEENEVICPVDKENITPNVSGNIIMERSHRGLKPDFSQELMDSISPLNLDHGNFSENENPMLNTGNQMKSDDPISENVNLLIPDDKKLQKSRTECVPISHLELKDDILPVRENSVLASGKYEAISHVRQADLFSDKENISHLEFKDDILSDRENSALAPGKYEAISPARQEDLFSDKENVTPASKVKPNIRRVLGSRMDNSVSTKNTSNKEKCTKSSTKSEKFHTVDSDVFYSDKENLTPISSGGMKARKCLPKNLTAELDQDQEAFCSDKENLTPLPSASRKTWDMSENRTRVESAIAKKRVVDRVPFQTLVSNSPLKPTTSFGCNCAFARPADIAAGDLAIKLEDKLNNFACNNQESGRAGQGARAWTMVANTDSLLDDESRKAIVLLKGIKGTHLFIPRIVIRELDSMKQREGLFRRSTKATSILQWIEECMATESWWIHVQSSSEMLPVAPTPPATPSAQSIDEAIRVGSGGVASFNPMAFFSPGSFALADIMSPRPEDRVLDCALLLSKLRSDHSIVVLSDSVTLKIKAMAEGVVCEGAKEFRESLMNPCSSRFMWAASAPRGSAWSPLDAAALAENYYNSRHHDHHARSWKRAVDAAKGLKLILRHNSLYAQATDAARRTAPPLVSVASV
ncbi:hypothetical protein BS78_05G078300 [Paspalum vaginatum]|nr:hypothetical protein BS78_05G078300 [Paspalum vaginatum]KAJ1274654.1 hypothetical protein BS78_05G078300 [Paspalum vaginatum]KAJ1274655.1 hypothetical protein BS78_05G078300 [Paspalum vaginatum]